MIFKIPLHYISVLEANFFPFLAKNFSETLIFVESTQRFASVCHAILCIILLIIRECETIAKNGFTAQPSRIFCHTLTEKQPHPSAIIATP